MMLVNPYALGGGAPPPSGDPYFANVVSLLHFDGAEGSTAFNDERAVTWTPTGPYISTGTKLYGTGSGGFNSGSTRTLLSNTDPSFAFGTSDFCIELAVNCVALDASPVIIVDTRESSDADTKPVIYSINGDLYYYVNGSNVITGSGALVAGSFARIALARVAGSTRLFVNGSQVGATWADTTNYNNQIFRISGNRLGFANFINGYVDEWRVTKGVGRYVGNYVPAGPFPNS